MQLLLKKSMERSEERLAGELDEFDPQNHGVVLPGTGKNNYRYMDSLEPIV